MSFNKTNIDWCDYTWNPVSGCKHDCSYCYARQLAETRLKDIYPYGFEPTFYAGKLNDKPPKKPSKVFVGSMGDLFGDWVYRVVGTTCDKMHYNCSLVIDAVLHYCTKHSEHTFMFLTKNPGMMIDYNFSDNCWTGTSVTCAKDRFRINNLSGVSSRVKFVSFEPLFDPAELLPVVNFIPFEKIDWCIIGLQTGKGGHKYNLEYKKSLELFIEKLQHAGKKIFIKDNVYKIYPDIIRLKQFPDLNAL